MYEKQNFYAGQKLMASHLEAMEDGIIEALNQETVSSWNDLTDKPFYTEKETKVILELPNELTKYDGTKVYPNGDWNSGDPQTPFDFLQFSLEVGKTYFITTESGKFSAVCEIEEVFEDIDFEEVVLKGESFKFCAHRTLSSNSINYLYATDTNCGNTFIISEEAETIHPIDQKFIPDTIARVSDVEAAQSAANAYTDKKVAESGSTQAVQIIYLSDYILAGSATRNLEDELQDMIDAGGGNDVFSLRDISPFDGINPEIPTKIAAYFLPYTNYKCADVHDVTEYDIFADFNTEYIYGCETIHVRLSKEGDKVRLRVVLGQGSLKVIDLSKYDHHEIASFNDLILTKLAEGGGSFTVHERGSTIWDEMDTGKPLKFRYDLSSLGLGSLYADITALITNTEEKAITVYSSLCVYYEKFVNVKVILSLYSRGSDSSGDYADTEIDVIVEPLTIPS